MDSLLECWKIAGVFGAVPIRIYIFGNLTMNSEYLIIKSYSVIGHNWSSTLFI
jgi:hypothetical protein